MKSIGIIGSAKQLVVGVVKLVATNIAMLVALILGGLAGPFFYVYLMLVGILSLSNPTITEQNGSLLRIGVYLGPILSAVWMTVICHWSTVRKAQREGRLATWREDEGKTIVNTVLESCGFMVCGFLGCIASEAVAITALVQLQWSPSFSFILLPLAVFTPVLIVFIWRSGAAGRVERENEKWMNSPSVVKVTFCTKCGESTEMECGCPSDPKPRATLCDRHIFSPLGVYKCEQNVQQGACVVCGNNMLSAESGNNLEHTDYVDLLIKAEALGLARA